MRACVRCCLLVIVHQDLHEFLQCSLAARVRGCLKCTGCIANHQSILLPERCAHCSRTFYGQKMALKIASLDSRKHHNLRLQASCLMALRSLWGRCVPHVLLAGALTGHGHGYGLGTTLLHGRHPKPGTYLLLTMPWHSVHHISLHRQLIARDRGFTMKIV